MKPPVRSRLAAPAPLILISSPSMKLVRPFGKTTSMYGAAVSVVMLTVAPFIGFPSFATGAAACVAPGVADEKSVNCELDPALPLPRASLHWLGRKTTCTVVYGSAVVG